MPSPWVAIAADIRRNAKMTALPSDAARYGWIVALGEAKLLDQAGTFTPSQWREVMGRHARFLEVYVAAGLLHEAPVSCEPACLEGRGPWTDGTLVVHDWPRHQREHARRQAEYKARQGDRQSDTPSDTRSDVTGDVESDAASRALSLSLSTVGSLDRDTGVDRVSNGVGVAVWSRLQELGRWIDPHHRAGQELAGFVADYGPERVLGWLDDIEQAGLPARSDPWGIVLPMRDLARTKLRPKTEEELRREVQKREAAEYRERKARAQT